MTHRLPLRQGDVLLVAVDTIPPDAQPTTLGAIPGRHVLAYGEVTGHHHSVAVADVEAYETAAKEVYLRIMSATDLVHQEHGPIALAPGTIWRQVRQVEYSPAEIRQVSD